MACRTYLFCFVVAATNAREAVSPVGKNCPTMTSTAFNRNQLDAEAARDSRQSDTPKCPHVERLCLPLRCPTESAGILPEMQNCTPVENKSAVFQDFHVCSWNPCQVGVIVEPQEIPHDVLANGSAYFRVVDRSINFTNINRLGAIDGIVLCKIDDFATDFSHFGHFELPTIVFVAILALVIIAFSTLLGTFAVYSVIPELRNMHGATLRGYVGQMIFTEIVVVVMLLYPQLKMNVAMCMSYAFIIHFSGLAVFFWLNVMCFDMWWNFGGFTSLQGSAGQFKPRKFVIYSVYAWGCSLLISSIRLIMDLMPSVSKNLIRPEFRVRGCWFNTKAASAIYHYGPISATVVCNVCLFVSTTVKIVRHKKDTAHHLQGTDSRRYNDCIVLYCICFIVYARFNIHLQLFIVMGMHWLLEIMSWLCNDSPTYVWHIAASTNTFQGVIIFVILVWKDKVKRLLFRNQWSFRTAMGVSTANTP